MCFPISQETVRLRVTTVKFNPPPPPPQAQAAQKPGALGGSAAGICLSLQIALLISSCSTACVSSHPPPSDKLAIDFAGRRLAPSK